MRKLLFFYADYCPACHYFWKELVEPVREEIDRQAQFTRINAMKNGYMAGTVYKIKHLPTIVIQEDDKELKRYDRKMPSMQQLYEDMSA